MGVRTAIAMSFVSSAALAKGDIGRVSAAEALTVGDIRRISVGTASPRSLRQPARAEL
jgi:hypothetical protein